mgnify:CR=1 FL=1
MKFNRKNNSLIYFSSIMFAVVILFISVGFSAFQNNLAIENINAKIKIDKDIRVTNVRVDGVKAATSYYEDYNVANISGSISFNDNNSYVIYDVEVYNLGNVVMGISDASIDNDNLKFEFLDYNLKDKICENEQCSLGIKKILKIKVSYNDKAIITDNSENFIISFKFGRIYNIDYIDIPSENSLPKEVIEGDTLNLNIINDIGSNLVVFMNNRRLLINSEYQYVNEILTIPNISGDIRISANKYICKRATRLHTEECKGNYCAGAGYKVDGGYGTTTITYGSLGTTGSLISGDAFDCDVNGDGIYDSETERFYYVTNMEKNSNVAVLIYYNSVSEGKPNNEKYYPYDSSGENWHGPRTAIEQLPTTSQWSNISLSNTERKLTNEYGTTSTKGGHTYPEVFSYSKYAARLLTLEELRRLVDSFIPSWKNGELNGHLYLVENTNFSKKDNSKFDGYWLETPRNSMSSYSWMIYATATRIHSVQVQRTDVLVGVRPVIEVSKNDISY